MIYCHYTPHFLKKRFFFKYILSFKFPIAYFFLIFSLGCIAHRDFQPGKFIFENILDSIKNSSKVILVLTKHFVESHWCQFEINHALLELFEPKKKMKCVIPLLLANDEFEIPEKLKDITYAVFTNDKDYIDDVLKLKKVFSPG